LRYEYEFLLATAKPQLRDAAFGKTGATSVFPEDRNNFGPRVGVSWEPFGGAVVRSKDLLWTLGRDREKRGGHGARLDGKA
jgi:hypothetical protein